MKVPHPTSLLSVALVFAVACGQTPSSSDSAGGNTPSPDAGAATKPKESEPKPDVATKPPAEAKAAEKPPFKIVPGQNTSFAETAKYLDAGGSFYMYLDTEQFQVWVDKAFEFGGNLIENEAELLGIGEDEQAMVDLVLGGIKKAFLASGLRAIDGMGLSTVELEGGIKRNVVVYHRDPAKGDGLIWNLFGTEPHAPDMLRLAPKDTALAVHGDMDVKMGLDWLKDFVTQNTTPEVAAEMAGLLTQANQMVELEKLLTSLGGQHGFLLTLDEKNQVPIPLPMLMGPDMEEFERDPLPFPNELPRPNEPRPDDAPEPEVEPKASPVALQDPDEAGSELDVLKIPGPGVALVVKVKDTTVADKLLPMLAAFLEQQAMELRVVAEQGVKISVIEVPFPPDVPEGVAKLLQPAIFQNDDYLVLATSLDLAKRMIAVQEGGEGLKDSEEFKKLAKGLDLNGNQFTFLSEKVGHHYGEFLKTMFKVGAGEEMPEFMSDFMVKISTIGMAGQLSVARALPDGYMVVSHTPGFTQESGMVMAVAVIPVAVGASVLLPAVAMAKARAEEVKSLNNASQLAKGVIVHAIDNGDKFPEKWCDAILQDVGGPDVFISPNDVVQDDVKASSYAINAAVIGKSLDKVPPETVLIFECNLGWNGKGDLEQLLDRFPHHNVAIVTADGSARTVDVFEAETLLWDPESEKEK